MAGSELCLRTTCEGPHIWLNISDDQDLQTVACKLELCPEVLQPFLCSLPGERTHIPYDLPLSLSQHLKP